MRNVAQIAATFAALAAFAACAPKTAPVLAPQPPVAAPPERAPAPPPPPVRQGPAAGSIEDFQRNAGDRVYFGYDQFELSSDARAGLEKQAAWLQRYPATRILISGNADERGTREYNLALGARRSAAAKAYLVGLGVAANRIETTTYGKERPIDSRASEEGWARNRNAHTEITSGAVVG